MHHLMGLLRFGLDGGVLLEPRNPYPFVRVILAEEVPIFRDFSWNIGPFFSGFSGMANNPKVMENRPMFSDICVGNGTHVQGFLAKKQPLEQHITVCLNMRVPPRNLRVVEWVALIRFLFGLWHY